MNSETERLSDLESYQVLDSSPEEELDELAQIASLICDTPISLITMIDRDRQWFKSKIGLALEETARKDSFCQHALHKPQEVLVVNDSLQDERFQDNPLVREDPNIRFYAGAPLETPSGNVLGSQGKPGRSQAGEEGSYCSPAGIFQLRITLEGPSKFDFLSKGIQHLHSTIDVED